MITKSAPKTNGFHTLCLGGIFILAMGVPHPSAQAGEQPVFVWKNPQDGQFEEGGNWENGAVPAQPGDAFSFNTGAHPSYEVRFSSDAQVGAASIGSESWGFGTEVVWDLGGHTVTLHAKGDLPHLAVGIGVEAGLRVVNGSLEGSGPVLRLGDGRDGVGTLVVSGEGTTYHLASGVEESARIGSPASENESLLRIEDGARVNLNRLTLGQSGLARGAVEVTGPDSELTTRHTVQIGSFAHGRIVISDGGHWKQEGHTVHIVSGATWHDASGVLAVSNATVALNAELNIGRNGGLDLTLHRPDDESLITMSALNASVTLHSGDEGSAWLLLRCAPGFAAQPGDVFHLISASPQGRISFEGRFEYEGAMLADGDSIRIPGSDLQFAVSLGSEGLSLTVAP